jgi:hypothetical protein
MGSSVAPLGWNASTETPAEPVPAQKPRRKLPAKPCGPIRTSFAVNDPNGQTMTAAVTLDVSDYGPQAPPTLPAADQVLDVNGLLRSAGA